MARRVPAPRTSSRPPTSRTTPQVARQLAGAPADRGQEANPRGCRGGNCSDADLPTTSRRARRSVHSERQQGGNPVAPLAGRNAQNDRFLVTFFRAPSIRPIRSEAASAERIRTPPSSLPFPFMIARQGMPDVGCLRRNLYACGRRMITRRRSIEALMRLESFTMTESERSSKRVLGHQVSAPNRPTSTSRPSFFAFAKAMSS